MKEEECYVLGHEIFFKPSQFRVVVKIAHYTKENEGLVQSSKIRRKKR